MMDSKTLERIAAEVKKLKTHPAGNDDYHGGYQDGRNDALTILEEAMENLPADKIEAGISQSTGVLSDGASVIVYFTDEKAASTFHAGVAEVISRIRADLRAKAEGK